MRISSQIAASLVRNDLATSRYSILTLRAPRLYEYIFNDEEFRAAFVDSVILFVTGFVIGVLTAVPLGILMARLTLMRVALETYILILYVTPMVALIPFILSIMGFDFWPKVPSGTAVRTPKPKPVTNSLTDSKKASRKSSAGSSTRRSWYR